MKDLGIYYSEEQDTILIGYKIPGQYRDKLVGRVIGHAKRPGDYFWNAYSVGYEYSDWDNGFRYIGRYTTFTTLKGYMSFLDRADYDLIKSYFKIKVEVTKYMGSYVVFRRNNGTSWFERRYNHN